MVQAGSLARPADFEKLVDPECLRDPYLECSRRAVSLFRQRSPECGEIKLTTLLTVDSTGGPHRLFVHAQPLGERPATPVKIQIMGAPRSNAQAKDSGWVADRQALWQSRAPDVHEVVLCGKEDEALYEGLSSNFFVIMRNEEGTPVVRTAREGVLLGTVRNLALRLCDALGMQVDERPPTLAEKDMWEEVFISSTSRWVLPVSQVVMPDGTEWHPSSCALTRALYERLLDEVDDNSTPLAAPPPPAAVGADESDPDFAVPSLLKQLLDKAAKGKAQGNSPP
mmetsp:Transcript_85446/g.227834  ORF Transcript_85446/g.227834 Transcript_85446/m.227834 type:complete len:282 (+) Transcript_85446:454-1299(+)